MKKMMQSLNRCRVFQMIFKESFVMCAFLILWKLQILFHSGKIFKLNIFEFSRKILKYFLMYFLDIILGLY